MKIKGYLSLRTLLFISFFAAYITVILDSCTREKESDHINIILWDKPLYVIQKYISGKWKLRYALGGLLTHKYIDTPNTYTIYSKYHITIWS